MDDDERIEEAFKDIEYHPEFTLQDRNELLSDLEELRTNYQDFCDMVVRIEKTFGGKK